MQDRLRRQDRQDEENLIYPAYLAGVSAPILQILFFTSLSYDFIFS